MGGSGPLSPPVGIFLPKTAFALKTQYFSDDTGAPNPRQDSPSFFVPNDATQLVVVLEVFSSNISTVVIVGGSSFTKDVEVNNTGVHFLSIWSLDATSIRGTTKQVGIQLTAEGTFLAFVYALIGTRPVLKRKIEDSRASVTPPQNFFIQAQRDDVVFALGSLFPADASRTWATSSPAPTQQETSQGATSNATVAAVWKHTSDLTATMALSWSAGTINVTCAAAEYGPGPP